MGRQLLGCHPCVISGRFGLSLRKCFPTRSCLWQLHSLWLNPWRLALEQCQIHLEPLWEIPFQANEYIRTCSEIESGSSNKAVGPGKESYNSQIMAGDLECLHAGNFQKKGWGYLFKCRYTCQKIRRMGMGIRKGAGQL